MRHGGLPIQQQILVDLIAPPVGVLLWRLVTRGLAGPASAGQASEEVRRRQSREFWAILIVGYLLMFSITLYTWLA
jgi:hypothetical protein